MALRKPEDDGNRKINIIIIIIIMSYILRWTIYFSYREGSKNGIIYKQALKYKPNGRGNKGCHKKRWRHQLHLEK